MVAKMKKGDGKNRFVHEFAILFVSVISVGILFFYPSINFTGFSVIESITNEADCVAANYTWEELTNETCTPTTTCVNETADCEPCLTYQDINGTQGDCTSWTQCLNEVCTDGEECVPVVIGGQCVGDVCDATHLELCGETNCEGNGYWYDDVCNAEEQCVPETCESLDACGSVDDECGGTLECEACDASGGNGGSEEDEAKDNVEIPTTTIISTNSANENACSADWQCGDWQECIEGTQVRVCTDMNECGSEEGIPATSQVCVIEVLETCEDGLQNQDETGVDCGGSTCNQCSILALMGNSITGTGKFIFEEMFGNVTKSVISIAVLVLIIVGFVFGFFFFKKKKNPFQLISGLLKPQNKKVDVSKLETY